MSSPSASSSSSSSSGSSSSTSSTGSLHHASLVDPSTHSPTLLRLLDQETTLVLIDFVVDRVAATVDFALGRPSDARRTRESVEKFTVFATNVITRAELTMPVILSTLVYVERARPHLHIALEEWALERVFLGAVMVASKYLNDSTLKNVHWAMCTGVFGKRDVGRIEREFLEVLDWDLAITEEQLLTVAGEKFIAGSTKDTAIVIDVIVVPTVDEIAEHDHSSLSPSHHTSSPALSSPRTPETLVGSTPPSKYDEEFQVETIEHVSSDVPRLHPSVTAIIRQAESSPQSPQIPPSNLAPTLRKTKSRLHTKRQRSSSSFASLLQSFPGLPSIHSLQKRAHFAVRI